MVERDVEEAGEAWEDDMDEGLAAARDQTVAKTRRTIDEEEASLIYLDIP